MEAAKSRLDIATSNLANASTDGFRKRLARGALSPRGVRIEGAPSNEQGALRRTGAAYDLALAGPGAFTVRDASGAAAQTRNGAFTRDRAGFLRDPAGRVLIGSGGPVRLADGAEIGGDGAVRAAGRIVARIPLASGTTLHSGFLETSNVNSISEMIDVLSAQRSFETEQKVVSAIDSTRQKASNELARLK